MAPERNGSKIRFKTRLIGCKFSLITVTKIQISVHENRPHLGYQIINVGRGGQEDITVCAVCTLLHLKRDCGTSSPSSAHLPDPYSHLPVHEAAPPGQPLHVGLLPEHHVAVLGAGELGQVHEDNSATGLKHLPGVGEGVISSLVNI